MCTKCPTGKYSLVEGAEECLICPKNAQCKGQDIIRVNEGYWRSSVNSSDIHECLLESACLGDDGSTDAIAQPYQCKKGFGENLCNKCLKIGDTQYQRTGDHKCAECINPFVNAARLSALMVIIVTFFIAVIYFNMKTNKDSPQSILSRILTNYVQIVTAAASFNLTFPASLSKMFDTVKTVGESARVFLSLDCFIMDLTMVKETDTTEYFKALVTGLLPIGLIIIVVIVWGILKPMPCLKITWNNFKNNVILSLVVCLFMVHPSVTGMAAGLYNCYEIDDGEFWLYKDLNIKCWDNTHKTYAIALGVPMMILWVIGLPFIGFLLVRHNKSKLDDSNVIYKYRILYQGYRNEAYYWEFVNVFRKVAMVMINIFLSIYPPIYKTFVATLTLAIILRQQEQIKPYKIKIMNEVEFRESTTSIITLFGGMFFILDDLPQVIKITLVVVIFAANIWFFTLWLHMFFRDSRFSTLRFLALFFGKISLLGKDYWEKEVVQSLKTDRGLTFLFGKEGKEDIKLANIDDMKEKDASDNIIGSSDNAVKGGEKYNESSNSDPKQEGGKKKRKKKKKKKMLPPQNGDEPKQEVAIDNQYEGDELPAEEVSNPSQGLDMSRDMDKTKDMDQTQDAMNAPAALKDLEESVSSSQAQA